MRKEYPTLYIFQSTYSTILMIISVELINSNGQQSEHIF